jgi:hypothetical protein
MSGRPGIGLAALLLAAAWSSQASAQDIGLIDGTIIFLDGDSNARCAAVNTINADFIIRSCDRRLVLLRGEDRETPYLVDESYSVLREDGEPAGRIRFATDNEGFRQVFWLSDDNFPEGEDFVLRYNTATDQLSVETVAGQNNEIIPVAPINVTGTECDPLVSFDGDMEVLCPQPCGTGGLPALLGMPLVLLAMRLHLAGGRRRAHFGGARLRRAADCI